MKKFIILLIALVILTSLAACAGGGKDNSGDTSSLENNSSDINSDEASSEDASSEESHSEESSDESSQDNGGNNLPPKELAYNIAVDKPYTAVSESYRTDSFGDAADKNGRVLRGKLTDGETAPSGNSSAIGGYGSDTLTVTIDLGERSLIYGVGTDCFGNQWGIGDPGKTVVEYLISDDGTNFDRLSSVSPSLKNATIFYVDDWKGCYYYYYPDKPVYARYVKVIYNITGEHVWSSEIFVFGIEKSFLEDKEAIPRVFIKTENNDRVHKSAYYPCELIVYDPSGRYDMISEPKGEIKIRGNSTSGGAKAPYNIRFSDKENVLGMGKAKKWYLIANMYDKTQIRNKLAFDLASQIGMAYVQESAFVEVYLNGVYRGCYLLCESIGVGETRVDIDITGNEFLFEYEPWENYSNPEWIRTPIYNILLGFNDPDYPNSTQRKYLNDFFDKAERAIATHDIEEIGKYIDIQSFVDAYIVQELFKQVDYATSSTRFYLKDGKLYEGPVWDFDLSAGNCSSSYYMDYNNVYTTGNSWEGWWCRGLWNSHLFKCKEIYEMVKERFSELQPQIINLYKDNDSGKNRIDALLDEFGDDIHKNYTVWSTSEAYSTLERIPSDGTYEGEIDYLRDWLKNRNEWLLQQFNEN